MQTSATAVAVTRKEELRLLRDEYDQKFRELVLSTRALSLLSARTDAAQYQDAARKADEAMRSYRTLRNRYTEAMRRDRPDA